MSDVITVLNFKRKVIKLTIIIGYRFDDRVLFVSDTLRVKIDNQGNTLSAKNTSTEKLRLVRPNIAIATAGLGTLGDAAVMAIRNAIFDPQDTPDYSVEEVIECCQEHFRFLHKQFKKYNPNAYDVMVFLLGGYDPKSKKAFLYNFESDNNFNRSENLTWIVRGPSMEENIVKSLITSKLAHIPNPHENNLSSLFANAIKMVSQCSNTVGSTCSALLVGNFHHKVAKI
ncbi:MAG: hypothetical protein H0Z35_09050 [Thermoanaerobacteraceae bacterium]|nr:hypothetical protein [Thermoanaerobacteraceae bacterium]